MQLMNNTFLTILYEMRKYHRNANETEWGQPTKRKNWPVSLYDVQDSPWPGCS